MKAIIILLFVHEIFANDANTINVGTVLFSPNELKKESWSPTNIGLLKARRYFQHVLPSPSLVDPSIDHFADAILEYFTEAVDCVKREELDPLTVEILTAAVTDAIGGYMKAFVIPVAKYGYYGGTVSKDDAQKIYQFYDDIKDLLKTNGSTWRNFDGSFQKPLKIIAKLPIDNVRATRDYCAQLTFYEETPSGYTIPLPSINFDCPSPMMFVPLKSKSLVSLEAPSSSDALFNYYQAAKKCLRTRSPNNEAEFDNRFLTWLTGDVIAHLDNGDDHLFYALGGILTLANDNKDDDTIPSITNVKYADNLQRPYLHINFGSKKIMILAIILFLEVVWCIPALLYMIYSRRRKKKRSSNLVFVVNPKKENNNQFLSSSGNETQSYMSTTQTSCEDNECEKLKMFTKRYLKTRQSQELQNPSVLNFVSQTTDVSKCSKGTSNQTFFCSKLCSTESFRMENERNVTPMRSVLKNSSSKTFPAKSSQNVLDWKDRCLSNSQKRMANNSNDRRHKSNYVMPDQTYNDLTKDYMRLLSKSENITRNAHGTNDETRNLLESDQMKSLRDPAKSSKYNRKLFNQMPLPNTSCNDTVAQNKACDNAVIMPKALGSTINFSGIEINMALDKTADNVHTHNDSNAETHKCISSGKNCKCVLFHQKHSNVNDMGAQQKSDNAIALQKSSKEESNELLSVGRMKCDNSTCKVISKFDSNAKNLRKDTNELIKLIKSSQFSQRSNILNDEKLDCRPCQVPLTGKVDCHPCRTYNEEIDTRIEELRTCATMTLISDSKSSRNEAQEVSTVCTEYQSAITVVPDESKHLIETTRSSIDKVKSLSFKEDIAKSDNKKDSKQNVCEQMEKKKRSFSNVTPIFGVRVEKPHTLISVDITRGNRKPSKIPTRVVRDAIARFDQKITKRAFEAPSGSKIPVKVKKTTDDIVIRNSKNETTTPDPRLNVSL